MEFKESELDIILAALNFADIHRPDFIDHLILHDHYETAMNVRDGLTHLTSTCRENLKEIRT